MASARTRLVPRGLLGMLVLVGLFEGLVGRFEPAIDGVEPADWRQTGQAAHHSTAVREASVLCFGDSLVKLGIQPRQLAAILGRGWTAYSLALCAGRAPASDFLLRRALQAGAKPRAIVVDFSDGFLAEAPETTLRLYSELLEPGETIELAQAMARPNFANQVLTFQALPSARNRFEIRRAILDLVQGRSDFAGRKARAFTFRHNWRANLGAQATPKNATPLPADRSAWTWIQPMGWRADPTNADYLAAFLARAEAHQIPVFWLLPPLHPGFTARRDELGLNADFDAFVAQTLARFSQVTVVDARGVRYDASVFVDMAHLDRDGSAALTAAVGAAVAEALAHPGPRIVALPPGAVPQVARGTAPVTR